MYDDINISCFHLLTEYTFSCLLLPLIFIVARGSSVILFWISSFDDVSPS